MQISPLRVDGAVPGRRFFGMDEASGEVMGGGAVVGLILEKGWICFSQQCTDEVNDVGHCSGQSLLYSRGK